MNTNGSKKKIRYAVVGLGHIAQVAVLPSFKHAEETSDLVAFVSDDEDKLFELSKHYGVKHLYNYKNYDKCLQSGEIDAVYIALPNNMHMEYSVRAAEAGIHVLCEKPMGLSIEECQRMIEAAESNNVKLMIAYRLHFEQANMTVATLVESGAIGDPRLFNSTFTLQVKEDNIRTQFDKGGGPLMDIGIYCINAARYIFKAEPIEVQAMMAQGNDTRFKQIEEAIGVVMKFPGERLATFLTSFGAHAVSCYRVIGTEGDIAVEPAYEYVEELNYTVTKKEGKPEKHTIPKSDQFAPELNHFSESVLSSKDPRPNGYEGLADLRVIEALVMSAETGYAIGVEPTTEATSEPGCGLIERKPPVAKPKTVKVESGSK